MLLTLNIELFAGRTDRPLNALDTCVAVCNVFPCMKPFGVKHAVKLNTEGRCTLVSAFDVPADMGHDAVQAALHELCLVCEQEAIAYKLGDEGHLAGPAAAEWGPFNPDLWVSL